MSGLVGSSETNEIPLLKMYTNSRSLFGGYVGVGASSICGVCVSRLVALVGMKIVVIRFHNDIRGELEGKIVC